MSAIESLFQAVEIIAQPTAILLILGAVLIGIVVGSLPGIGSVLGMIILLPLTLSIDGTLAVVLLTCIYLGGMYGASISSILLNVPGSSAAVATAIEGYPMSTQGRALNALAASATASGIGGIISVVLLLAISPVLVDILLLFGAPEYFLMAILGISLISVVVKTSIIKGITIGAFGLLLTTIGIAPIRPEARYTFGVIELFDGLNYIAMMLGIFAIAEMIRLSGKSGGISESTVGLSGSIGEGIKETIRRPVTVVKSSGIGIGIGSLPGSGAEVSNFFAYGEAVRSLKDEGKWNDGDIRGVIASESSNSATVGGAILPTLAFGVPGGAAAAVLLGGLIMHGIVPGPGLFGEQLHITYSMVLGIFVGSIFIALFGLTFVTRASYLTKIDTDYIIPIVVVLAMSGVFTLRQNWIDVFTILMLGFVGWYMIEYEYSVVAFVLGAVLGEIAEQNFHRSLRLSDGSYNIFVNEPLPLLMVITIFVLVLGPFMFPFIRRRLNS